MKRSSAVFFTVLLLMSGLTASAEICTIDPVPAATLLLPYFEVDLDDPNGINTIFSITNASATAVLAHVVFWTDLSVPTLDFNIYLTGYDSQAINLRDAFVNGILPRTASDGQDPTDTISPQGPMSQDINFASCTGQFPFSNPVMPPVYIAHVQAAHTGQFSPLLGACAGQTLGDNIARGYVTIDTVSSCTLLFPGDAGYFGAGIVTNQNVLFGDYAFVDSNNNFAQGDTMVHIEATGIPFRGGAAYAPFVPGDYTFYMRYVGGTAVDQREPLPTVTAARYTIGGAFSGGTDYIVWRDSKRNQNPFTCGTAPAWYPLAADQVVMFDEEENPFVPGDTCTVSPCNPLVLVPFPAEAQRVAVNSFDLPTPFDFGWTWLNLNTTVIGDPLLTPYAQSWVSVVRDAEGRFSVGHAATQLDSACDPLTTVLPTP